MRLVLGAFLHGGLFFGFVLSWTGAWRLTTVSSSSPRRLSSWSMQMSSMETFGRPYTTMMIVPTGVGASIGGFAGDALPAAKLLASVSDVLVTHPNVMNGAMLYWPKDNILYVEGNALNLFAQGKLLLQPMNKRAHRIGVILDKAMEPTLRTRHLQVIDAARATLGINVQDVVVTSVPLQIDYRISLDHDDANSCRDDPSSHGRKTASWGTVEETKALIDAARVLVEEKGCSAIAIVGRFPEDEDYERASASSGTATIAESNFASYRAGEGVDDIAGVEAILSHLVSHQFHVPCAHAPAFTPADLDANVSPKACAEELGYTFLPCVLAYLHRAPSLLTTSSSNGVNSCSSIRGEGCIAAEDVDAVVVPYDALGSPAVFSFLKRNRLQAPWTKKTRIIAVKDNKTQTNHVLPTTESFSSTELKTASIVTVQSYCEAAGFIAADKAGIFLDSLTTHVPHVPVTEL